MSIIYPRHSESYESYQLVDVDVVISGIYLDIFRWGCNE